jgi:hypothetical protein
VLPGQGHRYVRMSRELFGTPEACVDVFRSVGQLLFSLLVWVGSTGRPKFTPLASDRGRSKAPRRRPR